MGSNPMSAQPVSAEGNIAPVFSPVKVKVAHSSPTGVLSYRLFCLTLTQSQSSASQPGPQGFASSMGNLYPDRHQDAEPTFVTTNRDPVSYGELQENQASSSGADPQEKDRIYSEDQSYHETEVSRLIWNSLTYQTGSILPSQVMTICGPAPGAYRLGKYLLLVPQKIWFCRKFGQMNLYIIDGHVSLLGERGWLRTDQFLKVPETQNR